MVRKYDEAGKYRYEGISDSQLLAFAEKNPKSLDFDFFNQEGSLTVKYKAIEVSFDDALYFLLPRICFVSILELKDNSRFEFDHWTAVGVGSFVLKGEEIEVTGNEEYEDPVTFPHKPFLMGMHRAGERFLDLVGAYEPWRKAAGDSLQENKDLATRSKKVLEEFS